MCLFDGATNSAEKMSGRLLMIWPTLMKEGRAEVLEEEGDGRAEGAFEAPRAIRKIGNAAIVTASQKRIWQTRTTSLASQTMRPIGRPARSISRLGARAVSSSGSESVC